MESHNFFLNSICRLCLSSQDDDNKMCLIDNSSSDCLSFYGKAVLSLVNIQIEKNDIFPKSICHQCQSNLEQAIKFKLKCELSHQRLINMKNISEHSRAKFEEILCEYTLYYQYLMKESPHVSSIDVKNDEALKVCLKKAESQAMKSNSPFMEVIVESVCDSSLKQSDNPTTECENLAISHKTDTYNPEYNESLAGDDIDNITDDSNIESLNRSSNPVDYSSSEEMLKKMEELINMKQSSYNSFETRQVREKSSIPRRVLCKLKPKDRKKFTCDVCNKILASKVTLSQHMQYHNGCQFICELCGRGFSTGEGLQQHRITRHGVGPYLECDYCSFKAPRKLQLIEHIRLHTGERPFICDKCGTTFRRKAIWKKHLVIHTEKNHQCTHCPMKFFTKSSMLAHINNIHERSYVYLCNKCGVTYAKVVTVRKHMADKHGILRYDQGKIERIMRNKQFNTENLLTNTKITDLKKD